MNQRYQNAKYADVPSEIRELFDKIKTTRRGIYLHGEVGTGKTHIVNALHSGARDTIGVRCVLWNTTELLRALRADFDLKPIDKSHVDQNLLEFKGLLILDDLGAEKMTDWVAETFYLILNKRYNEMLPTIITSNLPVSALAEKVGDRVASRIVEMCDIVELKGGDRRFEKVNKIIVNV